MQITDVVSTHNPKAVMSWIEAELASGKFLVLPPVIYDDAIKYCREIGMSEKAIKNIGKSTPLK